MKIKLLLLAALFAVCPLLRADTSYLTIQGPFGPGDAVETYKWKVLYQPGSLVTGLDLLNAIFGQPSDTHTTYAGFELYSAGNATQGASYIDFGSGGSSLFTTSFTLHAKKVLMEPDFDPSWSYYVAGGTYPANTWTYSDDGITTRTLADGSYDGWVFGSGFPVNIADTATPGDNNPTSGNFTTATVVNVPEPGSTVLLLIAGTGFLLRRRRPL